MVLDLLLAAALGLAPMESFRAAEALLDRAARAQGSAGSALSFTLEGTAWQIEQSPRPEPPFLGTPLRELVYADPARDHLAHDVTVRWPYFVSRVTTVLEEGRVRTVDHVRRTHRTREDGASALRARVARRHPALLLEAAARARRSLRAAGSDAFTFVDDDGAVTNVGLDPASARVVSAKWLDYDPLLGDLALEVRYEWTRGEPRAFSQLENGRLVQEARYADVRAGTCATSPETAIPPGYSPAVPPPPSKVEIVPLGQGVELVRNAGGRDYHSLLVRFADHLVVIEPPASFDAARHAVVAIRRTHPQLPIRTLILTHHHYDHIAGIRAYVEIGARIVTTAGNVAYLRSLLSAPHTLSLDPPRGVPHIVAVPSGHRITDPANEVLLFDAGPTDHAAEILVAWLPRQKVLFQGDLFRHDPAAPEPARPAVARLDAMIRDRELDVRLVAGVHGEPATLEQMRRALERPAASATR